MSITEFAAPGNGFTDLAGFCGEAEPFAFLLANGQSTGREFSIAVDILKAGQTNAAAAGGAYIYDVRPVVAVDGAVVFDPLVPLEKNTVKVPSMSFARILVDLPLPESIEQITTSVLLTVDDGERSETRTFDASCINAQMVEQTYATVWAYELDRPIMAARQSALADLLKHGVNVNVVHPAELPGEPGKPWDPGKAASLIDRLSAFSDDTVHLIFLGWPSRLNRIPDADRDALVAEWIRQFSGWIRNARGDMNWVLYPTDEPHGDRVDRVVDYVRQFRSHGVDLPVYVNPLANTSTRELEKLAEVADYWQPTLDTLKKNREFFSGIEPEKLWLYQNPVYGPKRESPWHYRLLGWWAAYFDARGVGFWSYSNTSGSSAWSDFDGLGPDWSVVYEADSGIISSRRWEAFADGITDLRLYLMRKGGKCGSAVPAIPIDAVKTRDIETLANYRLKLFTFDCEPK